MPKEERRRLILQFLQDTDAAFPPTALHINLELQNATFSLRTTKNLLYELRDEGLIEHPEIKNDYYQITEKGRQYLENGSDE